MKLPDDLKDEKKSAIVDEVTRNTELNFIDNFIAKHSGWASLILGIMIGATFATYENITGIELSFWSVLIVAGVGGALVGIYSGLLQRGEK